MASGRTVKFTGTAVVQGTSRTVVLGDCEVVLYCTLTPRMDFRVEV